MFSVVVLERTIHLHLVRHLDPTTGKIPYDENESDTHGNRFRYLIYSFFCFLTVSIRIQSTPYSLSPHPLLLKGTGVAVKWALWAGLSTRSFPLGLRSKKRLDLLEFNLHRSRTIN